MPGDQCSSGGDLLLAGDGHRVGRSQKKGSTSHSMSKPCTQWEEVIEGTTAIRLEDSERLGAGPGQRQLVARMA